MIGRTVGNYQVVGLLGQGGMGSVYVAEHPTLARRAAIKFLRPERTGDPQAVQRLLAEARAANVIHHPNIVEIFDCGTLDDGTTYVTMEYLDGEVLSERLARLRRLSAREAVAIAGQVASALAAAHRKGVVHRDLKPENIFLTPDVEAPGRDRVKVLDFGIAKLRPEAHANVVETQSGVFMGSPLYMSPEQWRGLPVDGRTDIYALGCVVYKMLSGQPPFMAQALGDLAHKHIAVKPEPPGTFVPGIPSRLESAVLRALEKEPARRFQTMEELHTAIGATSTDLPVTATTTEVDPRSDAPTSRLGLTTLSGSATARLFSSAVRSRPTLALVGVAVVAAVVVGAFWATKGGSPQPVRAPTPTGDPILPPTAAPAEPAAPRSRAPAPPAPVRVDVVIESTPGGATCTLPDGKPAGKTPCSISWPRGEPLRVKIARAGYLPREVLVPTETSGGHPVRLVPRRRITRRAGGLDIERSGP